jgi:hypothetical protein
MDPRLRTFMTQDGGLPGAAVRRTPEAEHLADQERLLEELAERLASQETEFATLGVEFARFRATFVARFAPLYAELDRLEAEIARLLADRSGARGPAATAARAWADAAEAQADESAAAAEQSLGEPHPRSEPTTDLKALYRQVAKAVHPDLASAEAERARRTRVMAKASEAYAAGDEQALRRILDAEETRPEAIIGDDVGARLVRVLRKQAQIRMRLAELDELTRSLNSDPLFVLFEQSRDAWEVGGDPLAGDERHLRMAIRSARSRLAALQMPVPIVREAG